MTTSTASTADTALSGEDLTALRTAESVVFYHAEGEAGIRCYLHGRAGDPRIFTPRQQRIFLDTRYGGTGDRSRLIRCEGDVGGYESPHLSKWTLRDAPNAACFADLSEAQFEDAWLTVAGLLKAGDRLRLEWCADNNTAVIREAGLHADSVQLAVTRGANNTRRRLVFNLIRRVSPDNTARMIRRCG